MADALSPLTEQLQHLVWTRFLPLMIAATVVGLLIRFGIERAAKAMVAWYRSLSTRPAVRGSVSMAANDVTTAAAVTAPHCPLCNRLMIERIARRGDNRGNTFWGCPGFPTCKGTRSCHTPVPV